jgi:SP family sugar:H+ symporter-like MFS transporter
MILGGVNVGSTFLGLYFVEHFGRRKCLYFGAIWMFVCFMVFASIGHFKFQPAAEGSAEAKSAGMVMIVFACLFILAFASTWGPMVWAVIGEMFPYRYRAISMALATSSNWFWNFMLAFFTPFIVGAIDFRYGYVFAACNLAGAAVVYFFLMESAGRTLEEVDFMYITHVNPIKSHKWDPAEAGEIVDTDGLYLGKGGRHIQKRSEADRENVTQEEGVFPNGTQGAHGNVTEVPSNAHQVMSTGH